MRQSNKTGFQTVVTLLRLREGHRVTTSKEPTEPVAPVRDRGGKLALVLCGSLAHLLFDRILSPEVQLE